MKYETCQIEWKREYTDDLKKELIAFANTQGGELVIGIADDGSVVGVSDPDLVLVQVTNMIRDSISPDMVLNSNVEIKIQNNKPLVLIKVNRGSKRPYYISKKGMTPSGVYIRQGNSSVPASTDAIREMIKETDSCNYESNLSFDQNLTFEYCSKLFSDKDIRFGQTQKQTMKLINRNGLYTNLAMLLSDQCLHSTKFACFKGTEIGNFIDRQVFTGSILKQMDDAYAAMNRYNRTRSEIHGLSRLDNREFIEEVLREALVNSIVHRDYERDVSTNIRVFDDRIEIASYGGLPANTTIETFFLGLSIPRNKLLADVFYRLEFIEAFGSGIPKMASLYQTAGRQVVFKTSPSGFLVSIPSLFFKNGLTLRDSNPGKPRPIVYSLEEQRIQAAIDVVRQKGLVTRNDLETAWGIGRSAATLLINKLIANGQLNVTGKGKNTRYSVI